MPNLLLMYIFQVWPCTIVIRDTCYFRFQPTNEYVAEENGKAAFQLVVRKKMIQMQVFRNRYQMNCLFKKLFLYISV